MHLGRIFRAQSDDLGPMLQLVCSGCNTTQWFHLKRHSSYMHVLMFALSKTSAHSLHCVNCEHEIDILSDDAQKAIKFLPVGQAFATGKIQQDDFFFKLREVGFQFLKEYDNINTNWTCAKCNEESPLAFPSCWNCGTVRKGVSPETDSAAAKTPYLDIVMKNEGGPFGTMKL